MNKKPNIKEILGKGEPLHPDLKSHLRVFDGTPILQHPFVVELPYFEQLNKVINDRYAWKTQRIADDVRKKDWASAILLHERPYRLGAFVKYSSKMSDQDYWRNLAFVWIDAEGVGVTRSTWLHLFTCKRFGREESLMNAGERKALASMPPILTVHRGSKRKDRNGLSWTLSSKTAEWFANRFGNSGRVFTAKVLKRDVIAYFRGRKEEEIVLHPRALGEGEWAKAA